MSEKSVNHQIHYVNLRSSKSSSGALIRVRVAFTFLLMCLFLLFLLVGLHPIDHVSGIEILKRGFDNAQTTYNPARSFSSYAIVAAAAVLQVFQVYPPVLMPTSNGLAITDGSSISQCAMPTSQSQTCFRHQVLMNHVFANSYGAPFVGR